MHTITEAWIKAHATSAGGWTRDQFEAVGEPYPPAHGWIARLIGRTVTEAQRHRFERQLFSGDVKQHQKPTQRRMRELLRHLALALDGDPLDREMFNAARRIVGLPPSMPSDEPVTDRNKV